MLVPGDARKQTTACLTCLPFSAKRLVYLYLGMASSYSACSSPGLPCWSVYLCCRWKREGAGVTPVPMWTMIETHPYTEFVLVDGPSVNIEPQAYTVRQLLTSQLLLNLIRGHFGLTPLVTSACHTCEAAFILSWCVSQQQFGTLEARGKVRGQKCLICSGFQGPQFYDGQTSDWRHSERRSATWRVTFDLH